MKSAKRHSPDQASMWKAANPALQTCRERVVQFLPIGLDKVWFRLADDEEFELAGALGFMVEDYKNILRFGGFATADFKIRKDLIQKPLSQGRRLTFILRSIRVDLFTDIIFLSSVVVANARARDRHIRPRAQALAAVTLSLSL